MSERLKALDIFFSVILAFACLVSAYAFLGFYYETNDEMQMDLFFRGITVPDGTWDLYYWHRLTSKIIVFLYSHFPAVPWYGLMLYLALFLAGVHFFILLRKIFSANSWLWIGSCLFFFFFIFLENILTLNFLRVTLLLAISSFALFMIIDRDLTGRLSRIGFIFYFFFAFLFAYQIRPEGGQLVIGLSLLITVPIFIFIKEYRPVIYRVYIYMAAAVALIFGFDRIHMTDERIQDEKLIPYLQIMHNYAGAEGAADYTDSLKMNIATSGFFWDQNVINEPFLAGKMKSMNWYDNLLESPSVYFETIRHIMYVLFKNNLPLAVSYLTLLLFMLYHFKRTGIRRMIWILITVNCVFWSAIILLTMLKKMPNRLLTPLMIYVFTGNLIYFCVLKISDLKNKKTIVCFIIGSLLLMSMSLYCYRYYSRIQWLHERCAANTEKLEEIENLFPGHIVVFSWDAISLLNGIDPLKSTPIKNKEIYIISGWFNWYQSFYRQLRLIAGSDHFIDVFGRCTQKKNILVLSERNKNLLEKHIQVFYQRNPEFSDLSDSNPFRERTYDYELKLYSIKF